MGKIEHIDEMLVKHFAGEASTEEEALIEAWRVENGEEYDVLKRAWDSYDNSSAAISFNSEKAWNNVYRQSGQSAAVVPFFKKPLTRYGLVASLLLIAGLITFLKLGTGSSPEENTLVFENQDETVKNIILPDGSEVWMNQHSKLVYEIMTRDKRKMNLSGEVFFEVKKDSAHPFIVACKHTTVSVLGTSFNINSSDSASIVSVKTGLVRLSSDENSVLLKAGEKAFAGKAAISQILKTEENYLSWKTGEFSFENTPLPEIIRSLNTYYKGRFESANTDCNITAHFKNNSVEEIMQTISLICNCKAERKGNKILFR